MLKERSTACARQRRRLHMMQYVARPCSFFLSSGYSSSVLMPLNTQCHLASQIMIMLGALSLHVFIKSATCARHPCNHALTAHRAQ